MDQLRQMQAFVAVVQSGSFVKAADKLGTSKAVVSRLVLELEAQLATRLLHRTTRRQSLTEAGADYFERSRKILDDLAEANLAASAGTARPVGRLRINAPVSFGNLHLAPLWGGFLQRHPGAMVQRALGIAVRRHAGLFQQTQHFGRQRRAAGGRVLQFVECGRKAAKVVPGGRRRVAHHRRGACHPVRRHDDDAAQAAVRRLQRFAPACQCRAGAAGFNRKQRRAVGNKQDRNGWGGHGELSFQGDERTVVVLE